VLIRSRKVKIIVISFRSGKRIGRIIFIDGNGKTVLIKCAHYQDGRIMRIMSKDDKNDKDDKDDKDDKNDKNDR
jgi:hypothetical protein